MVVVGLGRQRQRAKVRERSNPCRVDALFSEERGVGGHALPRPFEELEQMRRWLGSRVFFQLLREIGTNEELVRRQRLGRAICDASANSPRQ